MVRAARKATFALVPTLCALGLLELLLAATGAGGERLDGMRGFDPTVRYLVPEPDQPGAWRTQIFGVEEREVKVPPKGTAQRVCLFGGSNTESFPDGELAEALAVAGGDAEWEVINLGRQGYGTARVAILFEQALVLEPDLVVLYTGHNEFVELGFQTEVEASIAERGPLEQTLSHLRTYRVLAERLGPTEEWGSGQAPPPSDHRWEHQKFKRIDFAKTTLRLAEYRDNVERMLDLARESGARAVLCTPIGNDLTKPSGGGLPAAVARKPRQQFEAEREQLITALPQPAAVFVPATEDARIQFFEWNAGDIPGQENLPVPELRPLGSPFADQPPWAVAPERWMPRLRELLTEQDRYFHTPVDPAERDALQAWLGESERFLEFAPDDPLVLFSRGLVQLRLDRRSEAAETLHLAAARDRAPRAANDTTNALLHELAAERPDVHFVDTNALYRSRTPDGIIGFELMRDECHLHGGAYRQLMFDLAPEIAAALE